MFGVMDIKETPTNNVRTNLTVIAKVIQKLGKINII
jgi:hypothetical protein